MSKVSSFNDPVARMISGSSGRRVVERVDTYGVVYGRALLGIARHSQEGLLLLKNFQDAVPVARGAPKSKVALDAFVKASDDLEAFAKRTFGADEFRALEGEIDQQRKIIAARLFTAGEPMPAWARLRSTATQGARATLSAKSALYQAVLFDRLSLLAAKTDISAVERMAVTTFQIMIGVVGNQLGEGWTRVFEYCAQHASKIAAAAEELRGIRSQIAPGAMSSPMLQSKLLRARQRLGGYRYPIRGDLGEIYLHHWKPWRDQLSSLVEVAAAAARKQGRGWSPKVFSGGVLIDGKKAWDEGILLVKAPTPSDRYPRAALHTAAQLKVALYITSLEQTIKDRAREIGRKGTPPILSIVEDGMRKDFVLEALPPDIETVRFVFNAPGGEIPLGHIARLSSVGLRVNPRPLDISIEQFDAVTDVVIDVAPEYLEKLGSWP